MIESGLGIVAGSAPALRTLLRVFPMFGTTERTDNPKLAQGRARGLVTIGSARTRGVAMAQITSCDREDNESAEQGERRSDDGILVTSQIVVDRGDSGDEIEYPSRTLDLQWSLQRKSW